MRGVHPTKLLSVAAFLLGTGTDVHAVSQSGQAQAPLECAGTTRCGEVVRAFLGGSDLRTACHAITWRLTLATARSDSAPMVDGPRVALRGTLTMVKGTKFDALARVDSSYTLNRVGA
jgi:hypothetical protein